MAGRTLFSARRTESGAELTVDREGIRFWNVATDRVHIEVEVRNVGNARSRPTTAKLRGAPLGAFVEWSPLTKLRVPAIAPGTATVIAAEVEAPATRPVADLSGRLTRSRPWPAGKLLEATGLMKLLRPRTTDSGVLPGDLMALLSLRNFHWAGNIDIHVGKTAVERHMARARMQPGRVNMTYFVLGAGAQAYTLRVGGEAAAWDHALYDLLERGARREHQGGSYRLADLHEARLYAFACKPPASCEQAKVEIHVEREPQGDEAVIEFDLDAAATGPVSFLG